MKNKVIDFYTNVYDEGSRLSSGCDNRHIVEREVKLFILDKYIKNVKTLCDIGAGTGLYSFYYASKGIQVDAYDIVPKHVELINKQSKKTKISVKASLLDIENYKEDIFKRYDIVLLSGPLYHILSFERQKKAFINAVSLLKHGGIIVVDRLSRANAFINEVITVGIKNSKIDIFGNNSNDNLFEYNTYQEIEKMSQGLGLFLEGHYGTDGITRFVKQDINKMGKTELDGWISFIKNTFNGTDNVNISEHCLSVFRKL